MNCTSKQFVLKSCDKIQVNEVFCHNWNVYKMLRLLKDELKALNLSTNQVEKIHRWDYNETAESKRRNYGIHTGHVDYTKDNIELHTIDKKLLINAIENDIEFKEIITRWNVNIGNIILNLKSM